MTADVAVPLLVVLPLLGAGASMALWRALRLQQLLGVGLLAVTIAIAGWVLALVARQGPVAVTLGGWDAEVGVTLVADVLGVLLLVVALATVLAVLVYAIGQPRSDKRAFYFHPLFLVLTAGVSGSFLAGDLFNLFVAFEVMLTASYVLLTLGGSRDQLRSGTTYVVVSLLSSALLVTAIGLVYAATGAVNMAEVAVRLAAVPPGVRSVLGVLLLVTFGIKAAMFPLFSWLPDAYPVAPAAVTAVFAGLLTKVGVYAIVRTQTLLFPSPDQPSGLLLGIAALTMLVGIVGAIAHDDLKRILSFGIVSSVGFMLFGLGLYSAAGVAGAIVMIASQIPVKTALFLVSGQVEQAAGTAELPRLGGLLHRLPWTAVLFWLAAASLIGLPPSIGFVGKLALLQAGVGAGSLLVTAVALLASVLTLYAMARIWTGAFWGEPAAPGPVPAAPVPRMMSAATTGLVAVTVAMALAAGPLWALSEQAAREVLDPAIYVEAVTGR